MSYILIDMDSCLAHGEGRDTDPIGEPYSEIVDLVKQWIRDGQEVRIFTARATTQAGTDNVATWLERHELPPLKITNVKDYDCALILDDRARQVKDGKVIGDISLKPPCKKHA